LQHFIDYTQRTVNGTVKVSLFKGNARIIGRSSPNSLYRSQLASFEGNEDYNQADAAGFIKLFGLTAKESYKNFILPD
jgi:argininosuccinate synthase